MVHNENVLDWLVLDARKVMTWVQILSLTLDFYIIYYLIYTSFAAVLTVEPTEYLEYKIKDGLVSF